MNQLTNKDTLIDLNLTFLLLKETKKKYSKNLYRTILILVHLLI